MRKRPGVPVRLAVEVFEHRVLPSVAPVAYQDWQHLAKTEESATFSLSIVRTAQPNDQGQLSAAASAATRSQDAEARADTLFVQPWWSNSVSPEAVQRTQAGTNSPNDPQASAAAPVSNAVSGSSVAAAGPSTSSSAAASGDGETGGSNTTAASQALSSAPRTGTDDSAESDHSSGSTTTSVSGSGVVATSQHEDDGGESDPSGSTTTSSSSSGVPGTTQHEDDGGETDHSSGSTATSSSSGVPGTTQPGDDGSESDHSSGSTTTSSSSGVPATSQQGDDGGESDQGSGSTTTSGSSGVPTSPTPGNGGSDESSGSTTAGGTSGIATAPQGDDGGASNGAGSTLLTGSSVPAESAPAGPIAQTADGPADVNAGGTTGSGPVAASGTQKTPSTSVSAAVPLSVATTSEPVAAPGDQAVTILLSSAIVRTGGGAVDSRVTFSTASVTDASRPSPVGGPAERKGEVGDPEPGMGSSDTGNGQDSLSAYPPSGLRGDAVPAAAGLLNDAADFDTTKLDGVVADFLDRLHGVGTALGTTTTGVSLYYVLLAAAASAGAAWIMVRHRDNRRGYESFCGNVGDPVFGWASGVEDNCMETLS
jgi:hypothetical protein